MSVARSEWVPKVFSVGHPIEFIAVPDTIGHSSLASARDWLAYSTNAATTAGVRLAAPVGLSIFACKGARARQAALPEQCLAAGVGLAIGVGISGCGVLVNACQAGAGLCLAGAAALVANYRFARSAIGTFAPQEGTP